MFSNMARLIVLAASLVTLTLAAQAGTRMHLGSVSVGAGYAHYSGSYWVDPYWYAPYWGPYAFYSPWFVPFYPPAYYTSPHEETMGQVRLSTGQKDAAIYIDGAYAGLAKDLRTIWLTPHAYDFELRPSGGTPIHERVYVLSGKTVKVDFARPQR